jgi:Na+/proline symporter
MPGGYDPRMAIPVSILLIAGGAILAFAVTGSTSGLDIHTVGWILMGVGLASVLIALMFWQSWAGPGYWTRRRTTTVDGPPAGPPY